VFAVVEDADRAEAVVRRLRQEFAFGSEEVFAAPGDNRGATAERNGPG
jgi:hypothetical protein